MPVYLLHGFRWPRVGFTGIRVHAITYKLDDISVEYIQNAQSTAELLSSFRKAFPDIMKELEGPGRGLTFLEQYDPEDVTSDSAVSQPFAFVGDRVVTLAGGVKATTATGSKRPDSASSKGPLSVERKRSGDPGHSPPTAAVNGSALSVNVEEVITEGPGFTPQAWEALAELRDKLAEKEKIGWWVVYNGDPERAYDDDEDDDEGYDSVENISEHEEGEGEGLKSANIPGGQATSNMPSGEKMLPIPTPSHTQRSPPPIQGIVPPLITIPVRDTGKPLPVKPSNTTPENPAVPPPPTKSKTSSKSEGFKKKFFGRKG